MRSWQKVYEDEIRYRAEIIKSILEDNELNPVLLNKKDSAYNAFGRFEVLVSQDNVLKAIKIINDEIDMPL